MNGAWNVAYIGISGTLNRTIMSLILIKSPIEKFGLMYWFEKIEFFLSKAVLSFVSGSYLHSSQKISNKKEYNPQKAMISRGQSSKQMLSTSI